MLQLVLDLRSFHKDLIDVAFLVIQHYSEYFRLGVVIVWQVILAVIAAAVACFEDNHRYNKILCLAWFDFG